MSNTDILEEPRLQNCAETQTTILFGSAMFASDWILRNALCSLFTYESYQSNKYVSFNLGNYGGMHEISADLVLPK